ncbi:Uncharacterised protein [Mycobacterium tuberculosis]|nr:Uncharacterised protein [Mycobacterium tuberculosis]
MYSRMSGARPLARILGTAAMTWSKSANGASTLALWSSRGCSLTITSVTKARVPSEPMISWVRS